MEELKKVRELLCWLRHKPERMPNMPDQFKCKRCGLIAGWAWWKWHGYKTTPATKDKIKHSEGIVKCLTRN